MANGVRTGDRFRSSVKIPEFDKHLKKAGGYIGRNVVEITIAIKLKTIVRKPLMIKTVTGYKMYIYAPIPEVNDSRKE